MSANKLLEEKKKEFVKKYGKSHEEYGFPYVDVVKYEVVFAKTPEVLELYKAKRLREDRKAKIAIKAILANVVVVGALFHYGASEEVMFHASFAILLFAFVRCLMTNYRANSQKLGYDEFIVMFGEKNFDLLDFPHPGI